ncbi:fructose-1,6-bisphosphate aldolase [Rubidibacter lacunae KORDI 51-2]|uniref:Probable fructose-bisphosphate aldolase class 1 n=1 Tax=Rubidibacter lacunae KORDI 51-2 TaxID=582515 RepID=U5DJD7_9CHRO|nr:class I fructose-bisphosphate aldolase [Rubidibacter lacunae]ERN41806.1 fructose-1,6-bisphosphate aldolase [Rubidibacter lacunae KORDI 51-2]
MGAYAQELRATAKAMVARGKGIMAMDESNGTCNKRFAALGIPTTEEYRQVYRQLILTAPNLSNYISGPILYDETIRQSTTDGTPFVQFIQDAGMIPGIKVDTGAKDMAGHPGEKVTEGLDNLRDRIAEYYAMGARFAKWRAVITIDTAGDLPSWGCIEANAHGLARYAALCQEGGLVPIVEPEVLIDGDHTIERCLEVTDRTLAEVFVQLRNQRVEFDQMVLKPSMVIAGKTCLQQAGVDEVAAATIQCLQKNVPATVAGIAFLSGGQSIENSSAHLNAMNVKFRDRCPWPVTFSYARAIQQPALDYWRGDSRRIPEAQQRLLRRAEFNSAASLGQYSSKMEQALAGV